MKQTAPPNYEKRVEFYRAYRSGANMSAFSRRIGLSQGRTQQIAAAGNRLERNALGLESCEAGAMQVYYETEITRDHEYNFTLGQDDLG